MSFQGRHAKVLAKIEELEEEAGDFLNHDDKELGNHLVSIARKARDLLDEAQRLNHQDGLTRPGAEALLAGAEALLKGAADLIARVPIPV